MLRWRLAICVALLVPGVTAAAGAEPAADEAAQQQAAALIPLLGDPSYKVREQAARELRQIGLPALPVLRQAEESGELEVRYRARRLLVEVERLEHERRLALFLKDPDGAPDDLIPGLKQYREAIGTDQPARELFVEMQRAEPSLFRLSIKGGRPLEEEFERRCQETQLTYAYLQNRGSALASVCAFLFIAAHAELTLSPLTENAVYSFVNQGEFTSAMSGGAKTQTVRKLLGSWIAGAGGMNAYQKTMLAMRHNVPEGIVPALEMVRAGGASYQMQYGILAVAKFGGRDHVPELEKLLTNKALITQSQTNNRVTYSCEVRDVALAALVHLTGQDPKPYGFSRLAANAQYVYQPSTAGFNSAEEREQALRLWEQSKAAPTDDGKR